MAPTCSNCGGTEFLWAGELKTGGRFGQGPLSLRGGGELPLGTRICRSCGHADLFLRDVKILNAPHHWRPGEFVPISSPAPAKAHTAGHPHAPESPSTPTEPTPIAPSPSLPPPAPEPPVVSEPEPATAAESRPPPEPAPAEAAPSAPASEPTTEAPAHKPASRRRSSRSRKSAEPATEAPTGTG
ncbi:MAG TPA: hypothetical protein VGV89_07835 [Thermoplasmata archaeon]|nr:hypothetical protein [Thermoplasmata archaeon]